MNWGIKEFNKEIRLLRTTAQDTALHPLRREQIKQAVLAGIISVRQDVRSIAWFHKKFAIVKYATASFLGISFVAGTVFAAGSSVPGDALYPVKKAREKIELDLAGSSQAKAQVQAKQAEARLSELNIVKSNAKKIDHKVEAENEAKVQVNTALKTLTNVESELQAKGNTRAAEAIKDNIQRIRSRAKKENVPIEEDDKNEDKQKDHDNDKKSDGQVKDGSTQTPSRNRRQNQSSDQRQKSDPETSTKSSQDSSRTQTDKNSKNSQEAESEN